VFTVLSPGCYVRGRDWYAVIADPNYLPQIQGADAWREPAVIVARALNGAVTTHL
jgi:hypothetical protein